MGRLDGNIPKEGGNLHEGKKMAKDREKFSRWFIYPTLEKPQTCRRRRRNNEFVKGIHKV